MPAKQIDRSLGEGVFYAPSDYVGRWRRLAIAIVDTLVVMLGFVLIAFLGQLFALGAIVVLLGIAFVWWYEVPLKRSRFRTLGYWLTGVKIVNLRGERPSLALLTFRALMTWVLGPHWLTSLLWCGIDDDRQSLFDCYAKTCLVKVNAEPIGSGSVQLVHYFAGGVAVFYPRVKGQRDRIE